MGFGTFPTDSPTYTAALNSGFFLVVSEKTQGGKTQTQGIFRKNSSNIFAKTQQIGKFNPKIVKIQ